MKHKLTVNDFIVVLISTEGGEEENYLNDCRTKNDIKGSDEWFFALTDGEHCVMDRVIEDYSFVYINMEKWDSIEVSNFISEIKNQDKEKIVFFHISDGKELNIKHKQQDIEERMGKLFHYDPFHHTPNHPSQVFISDFLEKGKKYIEAFQNLLESISSQDEPKHSLMALSFLCQGYLATFYDLYKSKEDMIDKVRPALEMMGWFDFIKEGGESIIRKDIKDQFAVVSDAKWWMEDFELSPDKLMDEIKKEWNEQEHGPPDKLIKFIEVVKKDTIKPEIINDTYMTIITRITE